MGYAGGTSANPTYYNIGDYSETVQVDFDPSLVSYDRLLDAFWNSHDPTADSYSTQYRSAIFYADEKQHEAALASKAKWEAELGSPILTAIEPVGTFYVAEDYHQKYYLQSNYTLKAELIAAYPDFKDFMNSTASARLNGYLGGFGDKEVLKTQVVKLGLSESAQKKLIQATEYGLSAACPVPVK